MASETVLKPNNKVFHLFVSYELNDEEVVKSFIVNIRKVFNIEIWFDREKLQNDRCINEQIAEGIEMSEMFVCFLSRLYILSNSCIQECFHAKQLKKRIIVVMVEAVNADVDGILNGKLRINAFKEISLFKQGLSDEFKKLNKSLMNALELSFKNENESVNKKCLKKSKQNKVEQYECQLTTLMKGDLKVFTFSLFDFISFYF